MFITTGHKHKCKINKLSDGTHIRNPFPDLALLHAAIEARICLLSMGSALVAWVFYIHIGSDVDFSHQLEADFASFNCQKR